MSSAVDGVRLRDASIRLDSMPPDGRQLHLVVEAEERALLAKQLGVSAIERLDVGLLAVRFRGGMRVTGDLSAVVVQPSVVTLEPVRQVISESIDRIFLPGGEKSYAGPAGAEIFVDLDGEDIPDHFEGPEADLSDLVIETLALAIDPYPRAAGESLEDLGAELDRGGETSPFAALEALKQRRGED